MQLEKLVKLSEKEYKTVTETEIVEMFQPLVNGEAFRFCMKTGSFNHEDDYIQSGLIGLMKAFRSYDISKGVLFYTYALQCIKTEIRNYFRKHVNKSIVMVSLDEPIVDSMSEDRDSTYYDKLSVEDFSEELIELLNNKQVVDKLQKIIDRFTETQKEITRKYYIENKTYQQIAKEMNCSKQYVGKVALICRDKLLKEVAACVIEL